MNKPISAIQRDAAFRDLRDIRAMVGASDEELIQVAVQLLIDQRDNAWKELAQIRDAIGADSDESTLDEVRRVVAQRDRWKADFEMQFSASKDIAA